ncbi:MAG: ribosomal RNA small subunit methyltransferase A [Planctomycetaceae bacterium]
MPVPTTKTALKALLGAHGIEPRRFRGQNYLVDPNLIAAIGREAALDSSDCVLEVGTGPGILTQELAAKAGCVISCDIDAPIQALARAAREWPPGVLFLHEDILDGKHRLNPAVIGPWLRERESRGLDALRVVANLPYSIATPFLANLIWEGLPARDALVLVQREAAERFVARPGSGEYGPMAVAVGLFCRARIVRDVAPQVFWPEPSVNSSLLSLQFLDPAKAIRLRERGLERLLAGAFLHRRKMLRSRIPAERLERAGIPGSARPEEVAPEAWVELLSPAS